MELNQRGIAILQSLREGKDFIKINDLAKSHGVSERAIRYNIDRIEAFLLKNKFDYLEREHHKGIKLGAGNGITEFIDAFIKSHTPYQYFFSTEERFFYIGVKLILSDTSLSSDYFKQKLCTSKNTILKQLDIIGKWFLVRNLTLRKKHKAGIWVEGKEIDKRRAITEIALQVIGVKDILNYLKTKKIDSKILSLLFEEIFDQTAIFLLDDLIRQAEKDLGRKFSDKAYCRLMIYLAVVLKRANKGETMDLNIANMEHSIEFETAKKIVARLTETLGSPIRSGETSQIMLYLLGAEVIKADKKENLSEYFWDKLYMVAQQMVDETEGLCDVSFGKEKRQIIGDLVTHLRPAVYRIKFGFMQANPIYDEIRNKYNALFLKLKLTVRHFEEYIQAKVDDQEISYLTMHFLAALERAKRVIYDQPRVIVVCGTGIGTAAMVSSKLMNVFNVKVVDTVSSRALSSISPARYDLIITTVDLPGYDKDTYLKVHPFLGEEDYKNLQRQLSLRFPKTDEVELSLVNRLIDIMEKYAQISDKQQLQYELMYEIKHSIKNRMERRFINMLDDLLTWDTIRLNLSCRDWKEAIAAGTRLLEEKCYITGGYKAAIINNFNELGPYMVVAPGIVLAHARPENGVNKLSMSLITLEEPLHFGHELNDPVKMLVTLAANDNNSHLKALSQLMELFMNQQELTMILNATNKEDVIEVIRKYSN